MLTSVDFPAFFAAVNDGHRPFAWQERLLRTVLAQGVWPRAITAPTGSGKSNVVDVHVFANALYAVGSGPRVPRRLSVVVNRRAIVDQHHEHAAAIRAAFDEPTRPEVVEWVREALGRLAPSPATDEVIAGYRTRGESPAPDEARNPLSVVSLRGGVPTSRGWLDDPRRCMVVCATPDMWGSRLLFRGYASSPLSRSREAGLLALDSVVVVDEGHLSRQLLVTALDVARQTREGAARIGVPCLQVVSTTATHPAHLDTFETSETAATSDTSNASATVTIEEGDVVGIPPDLVPDTVLVRRLCTPKTLRLTVSREQPVSGPASAAYVNVVVERVLALRQAVIEDAGVGTTTVGVIVNHVATAARVADRLNKVHGLVVVTWAGRMRPMDVDAMARAHPGVFTVRGCPHVDVLVATQTAEVGVDLDLAGLVTELAPAAALVQRFGRVNRLGVRESACVEVLIPPARPAADRPPYRRGDLGAAHDWLAALADRGADVAPWALSGPGRVPIPATEPTRRAWSRVTSHDAEVFALTSQAMFQDVDLAFWLRDDLAEDIDGPNIVVRDLPRDDASASALLAAVPPVPKELLPATMGGAHDLAVRVIGSGLGEVERVFVVDNDGTMALPRRDPDELSWLRPGAVLVIDAEHPLVIEGILLGDAPAKLGRLAPLRDDGEHVVLSGDAAAALIAHDRDEQAAAATQLVGAPADVSAVGIADEGDCWVVLTRKEVSVHDESLRQEWTPAGGRVPLFDHARAVGQRAERFAADLGLPQDVRLALENGGRWHDAGKADRRFQVHRLGNPTPTDPWAKSGDPPWKVRRRQHAGLPTRWRHEQLSAALLWGDAHVAVSDRALVVRLVGTSHGWGRPFFPHGPAALVGDGADEEPTHAAMNLFGGTQWAEVLVQTHDHYGVWGCAYLEAILRAADGTVSREGR